jgi:hypothetical protein
MLLCWSAFALTSQSASSMSVARFNCDFWCAHLSFLLDCMSHVEIYQNIRIYAWVCSRILQMDLSCELVSWYHWFSLYGSVAYIRNMVTLATIQSIFCIIHILIFWKGICWCRNLKEVFIIVKLFKYMYGIYMVKAKMSSFTVLIFYIYSILYS